MKAILLQPMTGPNPGYVIEDARAAKAAGEPYVSDEIEFPEGTVIDHPLCWVHCCRPDPVMAPHDDECKAKVHAYLSHPRRKALLAQLKHMSTPAVFEKLPRGLKNFVQSMAKKWQTELAAVEPDKTTTVEAIVDAFGLDDDDVLSDGTFGGV
jgi:hypothetical protein